VVRREAEEREEKGGVWERGRGVWGGNLKWERVKGIMTGFGVWFEVEVEVVTVVVGVKERREGES